ncbi:uncharacterized protein HRG_11297 [Hirsutella rhossiliensis]|uniref:Uncharacterized protein n=1 Tax=Hirsutella rhossiliensis TaxID=111463 RepID=A0A9P8SDM8_9HYPO|nr:uncharacterized protein HRG_11297 [Hirsutella rhossiliensis]KAH0957515.1 hypothetical protein HRG_11297 [Hirsutella rhossiliensis]
MLQLVDRHPFPLDKPENLWGLVSSSSLGALLLSGPFFKRKWIHLVWKLKTFDLELPLAIERLLNNALDDDTLDDGYTKILQISVYVEHAKRDDKISPRANVIKGVPDWDTIVREEVAGKHIKRVQEEAKTRENMIVTVSASSGIRIKMQDVVQGYIAKEVEMVELDYQPDE